MAAAMVRADEAIKAEEDTRSVATTPTPDRATAMVAFVAMAENASLFCGVVFNQAKATESLTMAGAVLGIKQRDELSTAMVAFVAMAENASLFCGVVFNQAKATESLTMAGAVLGIKQRDELSSKYNEMMMTEVTNNRVLFCAHARELAHTKNLDFFSFEND